MVWSESSSVRDEYFRPRNDNPWWNEASFTSFRIPERRLLGLLYHYIRPNQNTANAGPLFWDPSGEDFYTIAHNGFTQHMPIPVGAEMCDLELENGFKVEMLDPQKRYRFTYRSPGCEYDLVFDATYAPHYMEFDQEKKTVNAGMADFVQDVEGEVTTGHYDHFGRMNGTLILNGETIDVRNAVAFRDRTWGPRRILQNLERPRGGYSLGMGADNNGFLTFSISARPWQDDPVDGAVDRVVSGYYVKDGVGSTLVSGTRRRLNGKDGRPVGEIIEAQDKLGRTLSAEGRISNVLKWPNLYNDCATFWCLEEWAFDGHLSAPGELQDWMIQRHFRKWIHERRV